jgi:hypothetical protein
MSEEKRFMSVVEISLSAKQLADAYAQMSDKERRVFLRSVFDQPAHQQAALELLAEAMRTIGMKFSPDKQKLLDRLLTKNAEGKLRPSEQKQLDRLMAEYGEGLLEKARAGYVLELARQSFSINR